MSRPARRFLFVHQNFPAQFVHVAQALAHQGHEVVALAIKGRPIPGVRFVRYQPVPPERTTAVPLAEDFEVKVTRAQAAAAAMEQLAAGGFRPDTIVAHPGWGEALFCKDVWPDARLVVYAEFFYTTEGADYGFDPDGFVDSPQARSRLRLKNTVHLHALSAADVAYAPTEWQRSRLPPEYHARCQVAFDGIDTDMVKPDPHAFIRLAKAGVELRASDEVITFVNRNLEPYRGFHVFMRALPEILRRRPDAHCVIVGRDGVSYGKPPVGAATWREALMREVGAQLPPGRVHFLGGLPYADYLRVMQVSSCHVYMTYPFVLSWSCLEAMSLARVVVGSRTAPVEEVIRHGENGLLFDFFDREALAATVERVLADRAAHAPLGEAARRTVVERYDLRTRCLPRQLAVITGDQ